MGTIAPETALRAPFANPFAQPEPQGGCIVQIWPAEIARPANETFLMVETEFPDFASVDQALDEGRLVCGSRLWLHSTNIRGEKVIAERHPIAFTTAGVARMALPTWRFVEAERAPR